MLQLCHWPSFLSVYNVKMRLTRVRRVRHQLIIWVKSSSNLVGSLRWFPNPHPNGDGDWWGINTECQWQKQALPCQYDFHSQPHYTYKFCAEGCVEPGKQTQKLIIPSFEHISGQCPTEKPGTIRELYSIPRVCAEIASVTTLSIISSNTRPLVITCSQMGS